MTFDRFRLNVLHTFIVTSVILSQLPGDCDTMPALFAWTHTLGERPYASEASENPFAPAPVLHLCVSTTSSTNARATFNNATKKVFNRNVARKHS